MATNTLLTPSIIAKRALMMFKNNLLMGSKVGRIYQDEFVKIGDTVSVRRPIEYVVTDGATMVEQDTTEGKFTVKVDKRKHVGMGFTSQDLTLTIDQFSERYIAPAVSQLAHQVDSDLCNTATSFNNWVGTPGTKITSFAGFVKAAERLDLLAVPQDNRFAILSPSDNWGMVGAQTALYMEKLAASAYQEGELGMIGGVNTGTSQQVTTFTTGARGGSPQVNGANQNVTYLTSKDTNSQTLLTKGWSNSVSNLLTAGEVFTIANVYSVNPRTKISTGVLAQFVVTAAASSDGSGLSSLTITPAIITSGAYQNVNSVPADSANITLVGSANTGYAQNLMFAKNAIQLVTVPLIIDPAMTWASRATDPDTGLSIRIAKEYDITNDKIQTRLDIMYGVKALRTDAGVRLSGT